MAHPLAASNKRCPIADARSADVRARRNVRRPRARRNISRLGLNGGGAGELWKTFAEPQRTHKKGTANARVDALLLMWRPTRANLLMLTQHVCKC